MSTLTRYRSFQPIHSLRQELDRLFGEMLPGSDDDSSTFSAVWAPRMDLSETDEEFIVKMDLPGIKKQDVTVDVEDHMLTVRGERHSEKKEKKENYLRMERTFGNFYRSTPLPKATKVEDVKATFQNGVLTIHIPKVEQSKPRTIEIT